MSYGIDQKEEKFMSKLAIVSNSINGALIKHLYQMDNDELHYWAGNLPELEGKIFGNLKITDQFFREKQQWAKFYQKYFNLNLNFSNLVIPDLLSKRGWRLLIIAQGLTINQVYSRMASAFRSSKYFNDLDKDIPANIRNTKTAYGVWVRDGAEPDQQYLGKSTKEADLNQQVGQTLLERLIYEIIYFDKTGKHLDINGITFCSGSSGNNGYVPSVACYNNEVRVGGNGINHSDPQGGIREVISK